MTHLYWLFKNFEFKWQKFFFTRVGAGFHICYIFFFTIFMNLHTHFVKLLYFTA